MQTPTQRGRTRQTLLLEFLGMYQAATTDQIAAHVYGGQARLARRHLLRMTQDGLLQRLPHPVWRKGPYVYTTGGRKTAHSQKVLHHLAAVDFHIAVIRQLGKDGARVIPELPWAPGSIPDQTVLWRQWSWAIEHHRTGGFLHGADYKQLMEEEQYQYASWWRPGMLIGLLVIVETPAAAAHVREQQARHNPPGLRWLVALREHALRDPRTLLTMREG